MRRTLSSLCLIILSVAPTYHGQQKSLPPLEVRFTAPLRWERGCLRGGLDIVNHSPDPLLLTLMGPYYHMALDTSKDETQHGDESEWIGIDGYTDIIVRGFNYLAAGSRVHRDFCLPPTVWVVSLARNTRREIPVRGRLRVDVSYSAGPGILQKYKDLLGVSKEHPESTDLWAMSFAEIPCPKATCDSDCSQPPIGIHGERPVVPDVGAFISKMNTRGKALTDELSRKFPPCSVANSKSTN